MLQRIFLDNLIALYKKDEANFNFYLALDCVSIFINYQKLIKLDFDKLRYLKDFGFYYLWVSDTGDAKDLNLVDHLKSNLNSFLVKTLRPFKEDFLSTSSNAIRYLENGDLLRYPLEILQLDGAFFLLKKIFGSTENIAKLMDLIYNFYTKVQYPVLVMDHIGFGNFHAKKAYQKVVNFHELEYGNYPLVWMINKIILFSTVLKKLKACRDEISKTSAYTNFLNYRRRPTYNNYEIKEALVSIFFSGIGNYHASIHNSLISLSEKFSNLTTSSNGINTLELNQKILLDRCCNVSYNLAYRYEKGVIDHLGRNILRFYNRPLVDNEQNYPFRKKEHKSYFEDKNEIWYEEYTPKVLELSRLAYIVEFFTKALLGSPLYLPASRFSIINYMLQNSFYVKKLNGSLDRLGIEDVSTEKEQSMLFDGYLVDVFLSVIQLYAIAEKIPIFYKKTKEKFADALVIGYNENLPHLPILKILDAENKLYKNQIIDLSRQENSFLYIGEYVPVMDIDSLASLVVEKKEKKLSKKDMLLKNILDKSMEEDLIDLKVIETENNKPVFEDPEFLKKNPIKEDKIIQDKDSLMEESYKNKLDSYENENKIQDLNLNMEEGEEIILKDISNNISNLNNQTSQQYYIIYIRYFGKILPYGLGLIKLQDQEKIVLKISYIAKNIDEDTNNYYYRYLKLDTENQEEITIYHPKFLFKKKDDSILYILHSKFNQDISAISSYKLSILKKHKIKDIYFFIHKEGSATPNYLGKVNPLTHKEILTHKIDVKDNKLSFVKMDTKVDINWNDSKNPIKKGKTLKLEEIFQYFNLENFL